MKVRVWPACPTYTSYIVDSRLIDLAQMRMIPLLLLVGCLTACTHLQPIRFDDSQIKPWTEALGEAEPFSDRHPFFSEFVRGTKHLYFVAAHHENRTDSETFVLIRSAFERFPVQIAIVEDSGPGLRESPSAYLQRMSEGNKPDFFVRGEPVFSAWLASAKAMPFVGGEPAARDILSAIRAQGYSVNDFLGLRFIWQIPSYQRRGVWKTWTAAGAFRHVMQALHQELGLRDYNEFGYEDFLKWYGDKNRKPFSPDKFDFEDAAPRSDGRLFTQKLAVAMGLVRDSHLLAVIAEALDTHDHVLVVYGASHLAEIRSSLEKEFGKPRIVTERVGQ